MKENEISREISREKIELYKRTFCKGLSDDELQLFIGTCKKTGLSPEGRQIYAVKRYDSREKREVMGIQISIDGFRLIADRTNKYEGQTAPQWCGMDGKWTDIWLCQEPPAASRVGIFRKDFKEPIWGLARYQSYVQVNREGNPTTLWAKMPDTMLSKCAEAQALRKAFPQELSGLYSNEEMAQAENTVVEQPAQQQNPALPAPKEEDKANFTVNQQEKELVIRKKALISQIQSEMRKLSWKASDLVSMGKMEGLTLDNPFIASVGDLEKAIASMKKMQPITPNQIATPGSLEEKFLNDVQAAGEKFDEIAIPDQLLPQGLRGSNLNGVAMANSEETPWKSASGREFKSLRQMLHIWETSQGALSGYAKKLLEKYPSKKVEQPEETSETVNA